MARRGQGGGVAIRAAKVLGVALLFIVGLEVGLRAIDHRLDEPVEWYQDVAKEAVVAMRRLDRAGITSDVVFVGSSMIRRGVQIPIIEAELESANLAGNLGLPYANTSVVRRWLLEEVIPRLHPQRVVWGVQSSAFNGVVEVSGLDVYERSRAARPGALGAIDRLLSSRLWLSRYRVELRNPQFVVDLFEPRPGETVEPLEDLLSPLNVRRRPRPGVTDDAPEELATDFALGEREIADFRHTVRWLQNAGVDLVVVVMPVPEAYVLGHPNGTADFEGFRTWIAAEARSLGVQLFDYSRRLPDEMFADRAHLLKQGADEFSRLLAADLTALGW